MGKIVSATVVGISRQGGRRCCVSVNAVSEEVASPLGVAIGINTEASMRIISSLFLLNTISWSSVVPKKFVESVPALPTKLQNAPIGGFGAAQTTDTVKT